MEIPLRIRFFNIFRNVFRLPVLEPLLARLTANKGYDHLLVKCIPQNYQYPPGTYRTVVRQGVRFRLDLSEYMEWVLYFGLNVEVREGLYPLVKEGMSILDIGTNIGETLLQFARLTGPGGRVTGFEPVPENYRKCFHNISLNNFKTIRVEQLALSDKAETLFFEEATNRNSGGIFMHRQQQGASSAVQAVTLDEFVRKEGVSKVDLIKIDVEGFETNVLKGASYTCTSFHPVLFVEVDQQNLQRQGSSAEELQQIIRDYGYRIRKARGEKGDEGLAHYDIIAEPLS